MRFSLSLPTIITFILRKKKKKSIRQQSRFSGLLTAGILIKPPQFAAPTHTHTHVHCVPPLYTHEQQFLPVVLPAQLKPDTTADTAEKCRHSTTCINITRTGRACPFLRVACRHRKCVGGREGRWGDQKMTHVWRQLRVEAGKNSTLHLFSSFVFSLKVVVAWTKGVCARDESSHWASPRLPPPARLI